MTTTTAPTAPAAGDSGDQTPEASSSRLPPAPTSPTSPTAATYTAGFLQSPTPASVLAALEAESAADKSPDDRQAFVLRHALRWAVTHADVELVGWLAGLHGRWGELLDAEVNVMEDDEGWGVVGMSIQSSCGLSDKEEAVRLLVGRWGVAAGPRKGRDRAGWSPLHLAALVSTPQIVSVLLNRGASPSAITHTGLSAYDLITGMEGRESLALLLDPLHAPIPAADDVPKTPQGAHIVSQERRQLLQRRRIRIATRTVREAERAARARVAAERERWVRDRARHIGVNPSVLFRRHQVAAKSNGKLDAGDEDKDADEDEDEDGDGDGPDDEDVDMANVDRTMLVFSLHQLPGLFDILITKYTPVCQPRDRRALPANALYRYARFAHYQCNEVWLEELLEGAIERIERGVYSNGDDLASLAFWEYNLTLLLYLIRTDEELEAACTALNLLTMMEELINAIHVFIIRIAERKIDDILDAAMLDFESLEDFEDVRFQDQWNLFRSLGGTKKKRETPLANALFSVPNSPDGRVLNAALDSPTRHSRTRSMGRPQSIQDLRNTAAAAKADAKDMIASGIGKAQAVLGDKPSPRRVADILTSVHLILQLYEVNPAFIVQVFSQTFFWISSELFNRVITRKKYLCRTKAVQIRMNITALEDWTRQNGLPPNIATKHLEPIMQLLQWLQCSSQINQFDMLIGTVQSFRSLNPLQMRRAVRDYRFEVSESRMADDCIQYLAQLQRDWERRRVHIGVKAGQSKNGVAVPDSEGHVDEGMPIEALFDGSVSVGEWMPQTAPECLGELLDSRFMLPFLVPQGTEFLLATPPRNAAFHNLLTDQPRLPDGSIPSRPLSRASYSSSKPMGWVMPNEHKLRILPDDFFVWLRQKQMEIYRAWDGARTKAAAEKEAAAAAAGAGKPLPPLLDTAVVGTPVKASVPPPLSPLAEDYAPLSRFASPTVQSPAFQAAHARKMSTDLAFTRPSGETVTPPGYEAIELYPRSGAFSDTGSIVARQSFDGAPSSPSPSPHYELARLRRERKESISSINSINSSAGTGGNVSSSPEKKKWWKSIGRKGSMTPDEAADAVLRRERRREGTSETIVPLRSDTADTVIAVSPPKDAGVSRGEREKTPMQDDVSAFSNTSSSPVRGERESTPTQLLATPQERVLRSKPSGVWT